MRHEFTFIHTADLHLGREFKGLARLSEALREAVREVLYHTFDDLIQLCISKQVDFLIIAGDIFDGQQVSYKALSIFVRGMKHLQDSGIAVYLVTGNHDHYSIWSREITTLPSNVHIFSPEAPCAFLHRDSDTGEPVALLVGRSWLINKPLDDLSKGLSRAEGLEYITCAAGTEDVSPSDLYPLQDIYTIGVLHTGLSLNPEPIEIKPATLRDRGIDYWALGHIHQPPEAYRIPPLVYSGPPQGMQKKDDGMQSCCWVHVDDHKVTTVERIPTSRIVWQEIVLDVTDCVSLLDVERMLEEDQRFLALLKDHIQARLKYFIRLHLRGTSSLFHELTDTYRGNQFLEALETHYQDFYFVELTNHVHPVIDRQVLMNEGLFPSVLLAQSYDLERDPSRLAALLDELSTTDHLDYAFRDCSPAELLARATDRCLELLVNSGDDYE